MSDSAAMKNRHQRITETLVRRIAEIILADLYARALSRRDESTSPEEREAYASTLYGLVGYAESEFGVPANRLKVLAQNVEL